MMRSRFTQALSGVRLALAFAGFTAMIWSFAALAVWGVVGLSHEDKVVHELRVHGTRTTGVLTHVESRWTKAGERFDWDVTYLDGRVAHDDVSCACGAVGDPVDVLYLPDHPADAMTARKVAAWSPLGYGLWLLVAVPAALFVFMWFKLTVGGSRQWYRIGRHMPGRIAAERQMAARAQDYIDFVNVHQRRPDEVTDDNEAMLARWWDQAKLDAPESRSVKLVGDVLRITGL